LRRKDAPGAACGHRGPIADLGKLVDLITEIAPSETLRQALLVRQPSGSTASRWRTRHDRTPMVEARLARQRTGGDVAALLAER
jgi:hypothetical protein